MMATCLPLAVKELGELKLLPLILNLQKILGQQHHALLITSHFYTYTINNR